MGTLTGLRERERVGNSRRERRKSGGIVKRGEGERGDGKGKEERVGGERWALYGRGMEQSADGKMEAVCWVGDGYVGVGNKQESSHHLVEDAPANVGLPFAGRAAHSCNKWVGCRREVVCWEGDMGSR